MAVVVDARNRTPRAATAVERWVFTAPLWQLVAAAFAVSGLLFGFGPQPSIDLLAFVARHPFQWVNISAQWFYSSPLIPLGAWSLGIGSGRGVAALGLVVNVAAIGGTVAVVRRWRGDFAARLVVVAFFCSPLANLAVTWLGLGDMVTVFAATLVTLGPVGAAVAGGALLGFNHFEQGVFIVLATTVLRRQVWRQTDWVRTTLGTLAGLTVGRGLLFIYHQQTGIHAANARGQFIKDTGVEGFVRAWGGNIPTLLFSVYGVMWVAAWFMVRGLERRTARTVIGLQAFLTLPVLITFDMTRVYAVITWPLALLAVGWFATHPDRAFVQRWTVYLAGAAIIVPRVMFWYDGVYVASWDRFV